jgi:tetratricopeptide (TPR) repeat protein
VTAAAAACLGVLAFTIVLLFDLRRIAAEREASDEVSRFYAGILGAVQPDKMGADLIEQLRRSAVDARRRSGASQAEIDTRDGAVRRARCGNERHRRGQTRPRRHDLRARREGRRGMTQPLVSGRIEDTLGEAYHQLGLLPKAETHIQRAIQIRTAAFGPDDALTLTSRKNLVNVYFAQARYADSEELGRVVLEAEQRVFGKDDARVPWLLNSLGNACAMQNKLEDAARFYSESIQGFARSKNQRPDGSWRWPISPTSTIG